MDAVRRLRVNDIGEYIRFHSCQRRLRLSYNNQRLARRLPFWARFYNPIDPVLQESGRLHENDLAEMLDEAGYNPIHIDDNLEEEIIFTHLLETLRQVPQGTNVYAREVEILGQIGIFEIRGRIDFLLLYWDDLNRPRVKILESKRSRRDKTYHRIQLALYFLLVRNYLETNPLHISGVLVNPDEIECNIIKIDETTNEIEAIFDIEPIRDFDREESDITQLLMEDGTLDRIVSCGPDELDGLDYKLEAKCDTCLYSIHCFSESCRNRSLELLSIDPSLVTILENGGITNLEELVNLDLESQVAINIIQNPNFPIDLAILQSKASARISTLPHDANIDQAWPVQALPYSSYGQLPRYQIGRAQLIRVYLAVDYDYIEDRIVGLSAHLTNSEGYLVTRSSIENEQRIYHPDLSERFLVGQDENDNDLYEYRPFEDNSIVRLVATPWSGNYDQDTGIERQLISEFFMELVNRIRGMSYNQNAPIHFYLWSRSEITHLLEACTRSGAGLLANLRELFGCREPLEQLIFSSVQEEVNSRYALGYTGRGLGVASKLMWYGQFFHWTRRVGHNEVWLERTFEQDLFDFRTRIDLTAENQWARSGDAVERNIHVEIRSRFFDGITMPYWHAFWGTLQDPDDAENALVRRAIQRYNRITEPVGVFRAFFPTRLQALRWIEEKIPKNFDVYKELVNVDGLPNFTLGIDNTRTAALDFLRLDHHVAILDWLSQILLPPITKASTGRSIPVADFVDIDEDTFMATINHEDYNLDIDTIRLNTTLDVGDFVRVTACGADPRTAQRLREFIHRAWTSRIDHIDWESGEIILTKAWRHFSSRYILESFPIGNASDRFVYATLDEHIDDWTSRTVDQYLDTVANNDAPAFTWFNPQRPIIPEKDQLSEERENLYRNILDHVRVKENRLNPNQIDVILEGLNSRVQLLQGPPGTGKTTTTAIALLLRLLLKRQGDIILINTNTHAALKQVITDIVEVLPSFHEACQNNGVNLSDITICKVHSSNISNPIGDPVIDLISNSCIRRLDRLRRNSIVILSGTTNALVKMSRYFERSTTYHGFRTPMLIVDEASMIVFPHFIAIASIVDEEGEILLAGDHRQLSPITSHDWESEDRPPVQVFQPYNSVFNAIRNIKENHEGVSDRSIQTSALELSFRLPPALISLLSRLYLRDDIQLRGLDREQAANEDDAETGSILSRLWMGDIGLYLVLHSEQNSHKANPFEVDLVHAILSENDNLPEGEVAIITPHRAQRNLLRRTLGDVLSERDIIDTVEKLQGDERDIVLVSATVSNPSIISSHVDFILNLNRANVAFSRSRNRLIVVCSEELVNFIPVEMEDYDAAMLWKALRDHCTRQIGELEFHGKNVRIFTVPPHDYEDT